MSDTSSSNSSTAIVITGVGVVSPLGLGYEEFAGSLENGRCAIRRATDAHLGTHIKWQSSVEGFQAKKWVKPRKSIKLMCDEIQYSVGSAEMAVQHAGLDMPSLDLTRVGVVMGSEFLYGPPEELIQTYEAALATGSFNHKSFGDNINKLFPLWMLKFLPNMPACHIGIAQQAVGPNNSVVNGDTSCLSALAEAVSVMQRGWADVMITGSIGSELRPARVANLTDQYFYQGDDPSKACLPFDANRAGSAASEVAASFVLETEAFAKARGAKPLAYVRGMGRACELLRPYERGKENATTVAAIERTIQLALKETGCTAADIDHINANGLGMPLSDKVEAAAINNLLPATATTAIKSYFGNAGAGSASVELAASIVAFDKGKVPATLNFESPDPECPVNVITEPKAVEKDFALVLNQSLAGQAAALVIEKP